MAEITSLMLLIVASLTNSRHFVESSTCSLSLSSESETELQGFVFKSFQCSELRKCFTLCMEDGVCQSINYDTRLYDCQFNRETKRRKPENAKPKYLGVYMENPKRGKL